MFDFLDERYSTLNAELFGIYFVVKKLAFKAMHMECKVICKAFVGKAKMMFWYASRKRKKELYMCRESST